MRLVRISVATFILLVGSVALGASPAAAAEETCPAGVPYGEDPGSVPAPAANDGAYGDPPTEDTASSSSGCSVTVTSAAARRGESFSVGGSGFKPGAPVNVAVAGRSMGSATADGGGSFTKKVTLPSDMASGNSSISATGTGQHGVARQLNGSIKILESAAAASGQTANGKAPAAKAPAGDAVVGGLTSGAGLAAPAANADSAFPGEVAAPVIESKIAGSDGGSGSPLTLAGAAVALLLAGAAATVVARKHKNSKA